MIESTSRRRAAAAPPAHPAPAAPRVIAHRRSCDGAAAGTGLTHFILVDERPK